jgi:DDE_Tnp_1-associated
MPAAEADAAFTACFADLDDPRADNIRHLLHEILLIAFCAVLCGAEDPCDMALFGRAKEDYFRQFLRLPHGIPSHDTFSRLFRLLDPARFQACFLQFMQRFAEDLAGGGGRAGRQDAAPLL